MRLFPLVALLAMTLLPACASAPKSVENVSRNPANTPSRALNDARLHDRAYIGMSTSIVLLLRKPCTLIVTQERDGDGKAWIKFQAQLPSKEWNVETRVPAESLFFSDDKETRFTTSALEIFFDHERFDKSGELSASKYTARTAEGQTLYRCKDLK